MWPIPRDTHMESSNLFSGRVEVRKDGASRVQTNKHIETKRQWYNKATVKQPKFSHSIINCKCVINSNQAIRDTDDDFDASMMIIISRESMTNRNSLKETSNKPDLSALTSIVLSKSCNSSRRSWNNRKLVHIIEFVSLRLLLRLHLVQRARTRWRDALIVLVLDASPFSSHQNYNRKRTSMTIKAKRARETKIMTHFQRESGPAAPQQSRKKREHAYSMPWLIRSVNIFFITCNVDFAWCKHVNKIDKLQCN